MQLAREDLLARAGLALQQNRYARVRQMHRARQRAQRGRVEAGGIALGLGRRQRGRGRQAQRRLRGDRRPRPGQAQARVVDRAAARLHPPGRVGRLFHDALEQVGVAIDAQRCGRQAQHLHGAAVGAHQQVAFERQQGLARRAQRGTVGMQAQHRAGFVRAVEQPVLDQVDGGPHQRQHVGAHLARGAGKIQHAQHAPFAVGDRHRGAGQDAVGFEIVFGAVHHQ